MWCSLNATLSHFCESPLWDDDLTWNTSNPQFTRCCENTLMVWIPCLFLWLFAPVEVFYLRHSKACSIPFNLYNVSKLVVVILLEAATIFDIAIFLFADSPQKSVYIYTTLIKFWTFSLLLILTYANIKCGTRSSMVLFLFSGSLIFFAVPQFCTVLKSWTRDSTDKINYDLMKLASYSIYFAAAFMLFLLNCFADAPSYHDPNESTGKNTCPEKESSFLSRLVFAWYDSLAWKGYRKTMTVDDLWDLDYKMKSAYMVEKFESRWLRDLNKTKKSLNVNGAFKSNEQTKNNTRKVGNTRKTSVVKLLFRTFGWNFIFGVILGLFQSGITFANPQILSLILAFVHEKNDFLWHGFFYVFLLFVVGVLQMLIETHHLYIMDRIGLQIRSTLVSMIYRKALKILNGSRKKFTHGEILNLMGVDAQIVVSNMIYLPLVLILPIEISLTLYFLWNILGPCTLVGVALLIILVITNGLMISKIRSLEKERTKYKDKRIKLINEILGAIKVLKLYAYEPYFEERVKEIRNNEVGILKHTAYYHATSSFIWICTPILITFVTFGAYILLGDENSLNAQVAFVSLALFNIMQFSMRILPSVVNSVVQIKVSMDRINSFLDAEELDPKAVSHEQRSQPIIIENGNFSWEKCQTTILSDINIKIQPKTLVAIVGSVGSGKSSLLSAILGDMYKQSGFVNTSGRIAYVPQQAWIQNISVKNNITFGATEKNTFYETILETCALVFDLELLPNGDQTELGENGVNLSGGQKQRVSLARAVFSEADVYLLDDPLSAVDAHVGRHIFEKVIGPNGLLNKKTRILVTHDITYLQQVDHIFVMQNGIICESGTYKELIEKDAVGGNPAKDENAFKTQPKMSDEKASEEKGSKKSQEIGSHKSTARTEHIRIDKVKWNVVTYYLTAFGTFLIIITIFSFVLYLIFAISSNYWLSSWTSDTSTLKHENKAKQYMYLGIYGLFGLGQAIAITMEIVTLQVGMLNAAKYVHNRLLQMVLHWPVSTFDKLPSGRIQNRFGSDVNVLDILLPFSAQRLLLTAASLLTIFFVISYNLPEFLSVLVPLLMIYHFIQRICSTVSNQLRRLDSAYKSLIYSHFDDTIWGLQSIRAYNLQTQFIRASEEKIDLYQKISYANVMQKGWLKIRLSFLGIIIILSTAIFAVLAKNTVTSSLVGLSIIYALQVMRNLVWWVSLFSENEMNVVAIERIKEYSEMKQEAAWVLPIDDKAVPKNWPNLGELEFKNYEVRYQKGMEPVLRGITFKVAGGEKIGIVGRTGAGKSSLTLGLFRVIESCRGNILIDGVDLSKIGLHKLRNGLTIIPQDPVIFSGTLRMNLDPAGKSTDVNIWRALELANLKTFVSSLPNNLLYEIDEGGSNFRMASSVGQRQLMCLARALLRKTKELILDEATAAVDLKTDDFIQETIRKEFVHSTVLTIAHRLNTVMNHDRVMVMDRGHIVEFDSPLSLMKSKESVFYGMAMDAGLLHDAHDD